MAAAQRRRASAATRREPKSDYHTAPSSFIRETTAAVIPVYPDDTNADMFGASLHLWKFCLAFTTTQRRNLLNLTSKVHLLLSNYRVEFVFLFTLP